MLQRNLSNSDSGPSWWQDLGFGAPTIAGFASICSHAIGKGIINQSLDREDLMSRLNDEAKTILCLAAERGALEIRANRDGFDSADRILAVAVELQEDHWRLLLDKSNPRQTIRFLESFGLLCQHGLILHHFQREFSLSSRGFELAAGFKKDADANPLIEFGRQG